MPTRRPRARKGVHQQSLQARSVLRPGVSSHHGIYQEKDGEKRQSVKRARSSILISTIRDEGVLYTVKVAQSSVNSGGRMPPPPQSEKSQTKQYTISKQHRNVRWNPFSSLFHWFGIDLIEENVDSFLYKPSKPISAYINWTFYASFSAVFLSFLAAFFALCLVFVALYALVGHFKPECIVVSGEPYGTNPKSKFGDAFALSWTTFTTVGYGNTYPATGHDFDLIDSIDDCGGVVFLCTLESFLGLIYAGMCAAILFGKVNRIQSHAHLTFANAVCLQYEDVDLDKFVDDDSSDSDCDNRASDKHEVDESEEERPTTVAFDESEKYGCRLTTFKEQFRGCPVLKFQVMNDFCNKVGGEIVDAVMKVVGIKMKTRDGKITHSQYVRVTPVDFEHPFFGRVWHGVHILDADSPLLTNIARDKIRAYGSWPKEWFKTPEKIRRKLDFHSLIVTVSGISNVSACTVHAYKRYKFKDVVIGFDFAPLVYFNESKEKLEVEMKLVHDVIEQHKGRGEELVEDNRSNEMTKENSTLFHKSVH